MTLTPTDQRQQALDRANHVRRTRAKDKKLIYNGELSVILIILGNPSEWATASVIELLMACKRVGEVRARKICRRAALEPTKPLEELTMRQRRYLADRVTEVLG